MRRKGKRYVYIICSKNPKHKQRYVDRARGGGRERRRGSCPELSSPHLSAPPIACDEAIGLGREHKKLTCWNQQARLSVSGTVWR